MGALLSPLLTIGFLAFVPNYSNGQEKQSDEIFIDYNEFTRGIIQTLKTNRDQLQFVSSTAIKGRMSEISPSSKAEYRPITPRKTEMPPEELVEARTPGVLIICKYYKPFNGKAEMVDVIATAIVLSADGLCASNYHVFAQFIDSSQNLHPADSLTFAVNNKGQVFPIERVVAYNRDADAALFKITRGNVRLSPIPLGETLKVGSKVSAITHPNGNLYYYSQGYVNRNTADLKYGPMADRMEISADYAKGSSGGPIMNTKGNLVGMVSSTRPIYYAKNDGQQMVIRRTIPVKSIKMLLETKL